MSPTKKIHVHHLTRVEGHGDLVAEIRDGALRESRFNIVEAPRFFEMIVRGRPHEEVCHIASRICGICAVSHRGAALKATEAAMDIEVSAQTEILRRLAFHGEVASSHVLHFYFLVAPDYLGIDSLMELAATDPETVRRAMRLKKLAYDLCAAVVGRHTHPVAMNVGGFPFVHDPDRLKSVRDRIDAAGEDLDAAVDLFQRFEPPDFHRETTWASLRHPDHYALYDGHLLAASSQGKETVDPQNYGDLLAEEVRADSTAKYCHCQGDEYMVGALARFNNNHEQLTPGAKAAAEKLGLTRPATNPFLLPWAQLVETVHCFEESRSLIDDLLKEKIDPAAEMAEYEPRAGRGVGVVEAPRGLLIHDYRYDEEGKCEWANMIIPTAQNLANLESDLKAHAETITDQEEGDVRRRLEMLVRAYDPCISCSTH